MYNGYEYSQNSKTENNFYCTRRRLGKCRAKVKVTTEGTLVDVNQYHNHEPPRYAKIGGKLVRLNAKRNSILKIPTTTGNI